MAAPRCPECGSASLVEDAHYAQQQLVCASCGCVLAEGLLTTTYTDEEHLRGAAAPPERPRGGGSTGRAVRGPFGPLWGGPRGEALPGPCLGVLGTAGRDRPLPLPQTPGFPSRAQRFPAGVWAWSR